MTDDEERAGEATTAGPAMATVGASTPDAESAGATPGQRRVGWLLVVALVIALAAAIAGGVAVAGAAGTDRDRNEAVAAARQVAVNLTSMKADTADADLHRLLDSATGEFRTEFAQRQQPFVEIVRRARVETTGEAISAGLDHLEGDRARVLVAVHSTVRNSAAAAGEPRDYRLGITLERVDGRWLASKVDFIA
ncbi:MAG: hypothetical protein M3235_18950 [Actinomycetota bacterium]|nr:hypothetical protein [Actinomycetota bacterium]